MTTWTVLLIAQAIAGSPEPPQIRVTGEAVVSAEPEEASIRIGVTTEADDAASAGRDNATKLDAVLAALRETLGADTRIATENYTLQPRYGRPGPRDEPVITGYVASNTVRVEGLAIDRVGTAIDAAMGAGANNIHDIVFSLRDETAAKREALTAAAADAREKAETLADALSVRIVRILTVTENADSSPRPMYREMGMAMAQAAPPTPVEPGSVQIRVSVILVVEIAP